MELRFAIIFILLANFMLAQNIVPNPSFETTVSCPNGGAGWISCANWNNVNMNVGAGMWGTPDYFHPCGTGLTMPPATFAGTCTAQSGNAFMALVCYNVPYPDYREYLSTQLSCSMTPGNTYTVSFWITNGTGIKSPWTIKNIGVHFSALPLTQTGWGLINVIPQCEVTSQISTTVWTQYTFTINPTATWNYLTIGAFRQDALNSPLQSFPNPGGNPSVYCNYFIDNIQVLVSGGTLATSITSPTLCVGQSATIAASGASSYTWNTGVISPSLVITPSASVVYSVQSDAFACGSSGFGTVSVTVINDLNLLSNQYRLCLGDSLRISGNGTGIGLANQATTNSVVTVSPLVNTVYTLQVIKSGPGYSCTATKTAEVQVDEKPLPDFEFTQHPCGGGVQFSNLTLGEVSEWKWNFGVGTSTLENPYHFFYNGGTYSINLVAINSKGCRASVQETINIGTPPPVSVNPKSSICYGDSVQLKAGGGIAYLWWPNLDINNANIENPLSKPSTSRQYSVQITTTTQVSNAPCIFTLSTLVDVTRLDRSSIQANPPWIIVGNSSTLTYNGKPGAQVAWLPLNKISNAYTLITQPQVSTIYTVIVTEGPCLQTYSIQLDVYSDKCSPSDFFVPNVFTPNGDGQNDRLFVRGNNIADLHFVVYNRWGEMVFETYLQSEGWDGTYKGRMLDAGVYAWYFKTKCMNGTVVIKKGNVSVLR